MSWTVLTRDSAGRVYLPDGTELKPLRSKRPQLDHMHAGLETAPNLRAPGKGSWWDRPLRYDDADSYIV